MILSAGIVDLLCWRILILQRLAGILSINVPSASTTMTFHSPRTIVVTGRRGETLSPRSFLSHCRERQGKFATAPPVLKRDDRRRAGLTERRTSEV